MGAGSSDRRKFLLTGLGALVVSMTSPSPVLAADRRLLTFEHLHTGETLTTAYWANGRYLDQPCRKIDWTLRDHRTGETTEMSRRLLDALYALASRLPRDSRFQVISGYRSPATNRMLASASNGIAPRSLHMRGMAIDIRVPGCSLARLRSEAMALKAGGVGYYPRSQFIHVDVGRVRYW